MHIFGFKSFLSLNRWLSIALEEVFAKHTSNTYNKVFKFLFACIFPHSNFLPSLLEGLEWWSPECVPLRAVTSCDGSAQSFNTALIEPEGEGEAWKGLSTIGKDAEEVESVI